MIGSRDKDFEAALASPDTLERRLLELGKVRKITWGGAMVMSLLIIAFGLAADGKKQPPPAAPMLLVAVILQTALALSTQSDIRALMAFRKLRELDDPVGKEVRGELR